MSYKLAGTISAITETTQSSVHPDLPHQPPMDIPTSFAPLLLHDAHANCARKHSHPEMLEGCTAEVLREWLENKDSDLREWSVGNEFNPVVHNMFILYDMDNTPEALKINKPAHFLQENA